MYWFHSDDPDHLQPDFSTSRSVWRTSTRQVTAVDRWGHRSWCVPLTVQWEKVSLSPSRARSQGTYEDVTCLWQRMLTATFIWRRWKSSLVSTLNVSACYGRHFWIIACPPSGYSYVSHIYISARIHVYTRNSFMHAHMHAFSCSLIS
jgi:hypothetical protein